MISPRISCSRQKVLPLLEKSYHFSESRTTFSHISCSRHRISCFFRVVGLIDQVVAVGLEREGGAEGFVKGALPPFREIVGIPAETFGGDLVGRRKWAILNDMGGTSK